MEVSDVGDIILEGLDVRRVLLLGCRVDIAWHVVLLCHVRLNHLFFLFFLFFACFTFEGLFSISTFTIGTQGALEISFAGLSRGILLFFILVEMSVGVHMLVGVVHRLVVRLRDLDVFRDAEAVVEATILVERYADVRNLLVEPLVNVELVRDEASPSIDLGCLLLLLRWHVRLHVFGSVGSAGIARPVRHILGASFTVRTVGARVVSGSGLPLGATPVLAGPGVAARVVSEWRDDHLFSIFSLCFFEDDGIFEYFLFLLSLHHAPVVFLHLGVVCELRSA